VKDAYTRRAAGDSGYRRGPIADHTGAYSPCAIGFCPMCAADARRTTAIRGLFDCPRCTYYWYDERVGEQTRTFEDYFSG